MKSTQVGLTVEEVLRSCHKTWSGLNWIYWFPTSRLVSRFVQGRYDPLIQNNSRLKELVHNTDNIGIKQIGDAFIYFFGLGATTKEGGKFETLSVPADGETFDEVEKMQPAKVSLALQRMEASPFKFENYISTPGIPGYGIDAIFQQSDQKLWVLECEHCGFKAPVEEMEFPRCIEQGFLACKCGKPLDGHKGEWVPRKPQNKDISGYHVSKLYFPLADIPGILRRWEKAQTNSRLLEDFYHEDLGLPYVDSTQKLTAEDLLTRCTSESIATKASVSYLGVDVGGSRKGCHWVAIDEALNPIAMGIIREPEHAKADAAEWIKQAIKKLTIDFNPKKVGIDAQPEPRLSRAVLSGIGSKGWMIRYETHQKGAYAWMDEIDEIRVNRTESLDNSQTILRGEIKLPWRNEIVEEFAEHCANTARVLEEDEETGKKEYVYKKLGPDDYRHAFNYAVIVSGYDGTQRLTQKPGKVRLTSDSFYRQGINRKGKIKFRW